MEHLANSGPRPVRASGQQLAAPRVAEESDTEPDTESESDESQADDPIHTEEQKAEVDAAMAPILAKLDPSTLYFPARAAEPLRKFYKTLQEIRNDPNRGNGELYSRSMEEWIVFRDAMGWVSFTDDEPAAETAASEENATMSSAAVTEEARKQTRNNAEGELMQAPEDAGEIDKLEGDGQGDDSQD